MERNCARLKGEIGDGVRLCAVVKANGYGHGMVECAEAAARGGASVLAVAAATEAFELRERMPRMPILLMGALTGAELDVALQARAELNVWTSGFLAELADRAGQFGVTPRIHVKYDTGMGRLGERRAEVVDELLDACAADERVELAGLWTHFATADAEDEGYLREQLDRFVELALRARERHPGLILHAANSAATLRGPDSSTSTSCAPVSPIYGLDPFGADSDAHGLTRAGARRWSAGSRPPSPAERGESGRLRPPLRRMRKGRHAWWATVPVGYGDGYRRGLGNALPTVLDLRHAAVPLVGHGLAWTT